MGAAASTRSKHNIWWDANGCTQLHRAVIVGNITIVEEVLNAVDDDNRDELLFAVNPHGATALHFAAQHGHTDVVRLLVQKCVSAGADVGKLLLLQGRAGGGTTIVHATARDGHAGVLRELLRAVGEMPSKSGHEEDDNCVVLGSPKKALSPSATATQSIDIKHLPPVANNHRVGSFSRVAFHSSFCCAEDILCARDEFGHTVLHAAVSNHQIEAVREVLSAASFSLRPSKMLETVIFAKDTRGDTALHIAVRNGDLLLVQLLLNAGREAAEAAAKEEILRSPHTLPHTPSTASQTPRSTESTPKVSPNFPIKCDEETSAMISALTGEEVGIQSPLDPEGGVPIIDDYSYVAYTDSPIAIGSTAGKWASWSSSSSTPGGAALGNGVSTPQGPSWKRWKSAKPRVQKDETPAAEQLYKALTIRNKEGVAVLGISAARKDPELLRELLRQMSEIFRNFESKYVEVLNYRDLSGRTCLHAAVLTNSPTVTDLLELEKLNVTASDNMGLTALHLACKIGSVHAVATLLADRRFNPNSGVSPSRHN